MHTCVCYIWFQLQLGLYTSMEDAYVCLLPLVSVAVRIVYEYGRCIRVFATFGFSCS